METKKRKNDLILIAVFLAAAVSAYLGLLFFQGASTKSGVAVVTIHGAEYGRYPLTMDITERIKLSDGSYNVLEIKDGEAEITEASCPDGICVKHRPISRKGQSIVCLPNKVIVEIENGEASELDFITN